VSFDGVGNLYVTDQQTTRVRKVTLAGQVTTIAGGSPGDSNGVGAFAAFSAPSYTAIDSGGNIYVADSNNNKIRKITLGTDISSATTAKYTVPGVTTSAAGDYDCVVTDAAGVKVVSVPTSVLVFNAPPTNATIVGSGSVTLSASAVGTGSLTYQWRKREATGTVTTFAGTGTSGAADGTGTGASFNSPTSIGTDVAGNIYVCDAAGHRIRKITPSGVVTTIAGNGTSGSADGIGTAATFNFPHGAAVDGAGNVYVADDQNHKIRKITRPVWLRHWRGAARQVW